MNLHVNGSSELLSSVDSVAAKLLLDAQDLVEFGKTLGTGRRTSFD
jgi:hypothetical protein